MVSPVSPAIENKKDKAEAEKERGVQPDRALIKR